LLQEVAVTPTTSPITVQLAAPQIGASNTLQVSSDGPTPAFWSAALTYHAAATPAPNPDLAVERRYLLANGTPVSGPIPIGTPIQVELTVKNAAPLDYVQVRDALPAGLEALNPALATSQSETSVNQRPPNYDQIDRRDQEVDFYITRLAAGSHTFAYAARASAAGTFQVPSATAAQMYAPTVRGASPGGTLVVGS
jgi:uncharacterized protein YfaS (alpha-2-macroglobulin family)